MRNFNGKHIHFSLGYWVHVSWIFMKFSESSQCVNQCNTITTTQYSWGPVDKKTLAKIDYRCYLFYQQYGTLWNLTSWHLMLSEEYKNILYLTVFLFNWRWNARGWRNSLLMKTVIFTLDTPDSKVHGANMGLTWVLSAPDGPHVCPTNLAIRDSLCHGCWWPRVARSRDISRHGFDLVCTGHSDLSVRSD